MSHVDVDELTRNGPFEMLLQTDLAPNPVTQCAAEKKDSFKTTSSGVAQRLTSKLHIFLGADFGLRSVACAYQLTLSFFFWAPAEPICLYEEKARQ